MSAANLRVILAAALLLPQMVAGAPGVEDIKRAVEHHYNTVRSLEADFVQRYTLGKDTLVESGHVYFLKPGRMRWDYDSGKLFLTDGDYAYLYLPRERQVRRQPMKKAEQWQAALALLLGKVELARLCEPLQLVAVSRPDAALRWQLRCPAKSNKLAFYEMWLDLDSSYRVLRIEIRQRDGSLMEFHFRRWQEGEPLAHELFQLRLPPGVAWLEEGSE